MDAAVQPKLLKVLEEQRFRRLGEVRDRQVDVRLIAGSHRDLAQMAEQQQFRRDLFYRINTVTLHRAGRCASASATSFCWRDRCSRASPPSWGAPA